MVWFGNLEEIVFISDMIKFKNGNMCLNKLYFNLIFSDFSIVYKNIIQTDNQKTGTDRILN